MLRRLVLGSLVALGLAGCRQSGDGATGRTAQEPESQTPQASLAGPDPALPPTAYRDTTPELRAQVDAGPAALDEVRLEGLLDLIRTAFDGSAGTRLASRAERSLHDEPGIDLALEHALVHEASPLVRAASARLLGERGCVGVLPLLIHQTKYEKEWIPYAAVCEALAALGNDAGAVLLDACIDIPQAQSAAGAAALRLLASVGLPQPEGVSWELLRIDLRRVAEQWRQTGRPFNLDGAGEETLRTPADPTDPMLRARLAQRVLDLAESQLRPVDDSRLVFRSLGRVGLEALRFGLVDMNAFIRLSCLEVVRDLGPVASPLLPEVLPQFDDPLTGTIACIAAGRLEDASVLPYLTVRAFSESLATKKAAVEGLAWLRHPDGLAVLRDRLTDEEEIDDVRVQAALGVALFDEGVRFLLEVRESGRYHPPTVAECLDLIESERRRSGAR